MSELKGTPAYVLPNQSTYNTANGQMFVHKIMMHGSDEYGDYHSKSATCEKFKVGQEVAYTREVKPGSGNFPPTVRYKPVSQNANNFNGSGGNRGGYSKGSYQKDMVWEIADKKLILSQNAMARAVEIGCASPPPQGVDLKTHIFNLHGEIYNRIMLLAGTDAVIEYYKKKAAGASAPPTPPATSQSAPLPPPPAPPTQQAPPPPPPVYEDPSGPSDQLPF